MQRCLRQLWCTSALHDVALRVRHIPGEHNTLANALSRWDNTSSHTQFAQATTAQRIHNPTNDWKESGIHYLKSGIHCLESRIQDLFEVLDIM